MLPGKQYAPEDLVQILKRRVWVLLVPFALVSAATAVVARRLPNVYKSEALVLVVPQQVPQAYVPSTVTMPIEARLQSIQQQIMSRTKLEEIIKELNLYPDERRTGIMEDVVERMRTDIAATPIRGDAFSVTYQGSDPKVVQKVTEELAGLFITESLTDQERLTEDTSQFLEGQVDEARRRLAEQERKLAEYRAKYAGELPTQLDANLHALSDTQAQLQQLFEVDDRESERELTYEHSLKDLEQGDTSSLATAPPMVTPAGATPAGATTASATPAAISGGTAAQRLDAAKSALKALEVRGWTDDHPDVKAAKRLIVDLEAQAEQEALTRPVSDPATVNPIEQARLGRMQQLREVIAQIEAQSKARTEQETKLRTQATVLQQRIDAVPTRESELTELSRDYPVLGQIYDNLLVKKEDSNVAANLERRQIGEQFKLIDPAQVPEKPFKPDRKAIDLEGMGAGLGLGVVLIGLLEYLDSSFATDEEVTALLQLPVLAVVPFMRSEASERHLARRRFVANLGLASAVVACLTVVAYAFLH